MSKEKIGFVGLGAMGKPMARGLMEGGIDTMVYDIREEPMKELEKLGAGLARSPQELCDSCNIILTMVQDVSQTEAIVLGEHGLLSSPKEGSSIVIMSTLDPIFCQRVSVIASKKGVGVLDAPASGGPKGAEAHTLTFTVGGETSVFERCRYLLEVMGKRIFHVGKVGAGQSIKIANNSIVVATAIATAGGIALAQTVGVDAEQFLEIIRSNTGNSWTAQNWDFWLNKTTSEGRRTLSITYKDLALSMDLAKAYNHSLPLAEAISKLDIYSVLAGIRKE